MRLFDGLWKGNEGIVEEACGRCDPLIGFSFRMFLNWDFKGLIRMTFCYLMYLKV